MAIENHKELDIYKLSFHLSMKIHSLSKTFPSEEKFALTDQIRRSSRAVCANIAEGWRKRRYPNSFSLSLNNAEAEAAETQTWIDFAFHCNYIYEQQATELSKQYDFVIGKLVNMIRHPQPWILPDHRIREEGPSYE